MAQYQGLSNQEAKARLQQYGHNLIQTSSGVSWWKILLQQFESPIMLVMIAAAILSGAIGFLPDQSGHWTDTILILSIVLLSGILGFFQDYRAEKTIEELQKMMSPSARAYRDGELTEVPSREIVPGDLLQLEAGDIVAADGQVTERQNLQIDESILTGESEAVSKEKGNDAYMNSSVTGGRGKVQVQKTGMDTEMGSVAEKLATMQNEESSFQQELATFSKYLSYLVLGVAVAVFAVGYFKYGLLQSLMISISMAVAAIPSGLPAVVVISLTIGARIILKKNALIRTLPIVESVGAVDIICTDKTGTLTKNQMTVLHLYADHHRTELEEEKPDTENQPLLRELLTCGALCNNVKVSGQGKDQRFIGEQTEVALMRSALEHLGKNPGPEWEREDEVPFSSDTKRMTVKVRNQSQQRIYAKGAPEVILQACNWIYTDEGISEITEEDREAIRKETRLLAERALRVLAFAMKEEAGDNMEQDMVFLGLQAMIDPPRDAVPQAIEDCHTAGIRVIMITGDNPITAKAIGEKIGLYSDDVVEGPDIEAMSDEALKEKLQNKVNIFARTSPFHKLRIMEQLGDDHTVAMTGDGVNDALALKKAGVGIAMGEKGTEVAKQASDIILLNDDFSTIRDALRQGRTIFANIRKFIDYMLTCNMAEVLVIFLATLFFTLDGPVLLAAQILWINLLTDGLVAIALGADPPSKGIMQEPPRPRDEHIINRQTSYRILTFGTLISAILLGMAALLNYGGLDFLNYDVPLGKTRTLLMTGFVLLEFVRIATIRSSEKLTFFDNKFLIGALLGSVALQVVIIYTPVNEFFHLVPLAVVDWVVLLVAVAAAYLISMALMQLPYLRKRGS